MKDYYITLSNISLSNYILTDKGKLYQKVPTQVEILPDQEHRFSLVDDCGNRKRISLKSLYRQAFDKEFAVDPTISMPDEEWRISTISDKYFVSNLGRVKSLCKYEATILKPYNINGYLYVKINGKNVRIHRIIAFSFCENKYREQPIEVHHINFKSTDNRAINLEILTPEEHRQKHYNNDIQL